MVLVAAVLLVALFANREDRGTEGREGVFPTTLFHPDESHTSGSLEPAKPRTEVDESESADRAPVAVARDAHSAPTR